MTGVTVMCLTIFVSPANRASDAIVEQDAEVAQPFKAIVEL